MEIDRLIRILHPLEREVVPVLKEEKDFSEIVKKSGLKEVEVMRALQWLENKGVLEIKKKSEKLVRLGIKGEEYLRKGLPERRLLEAIKEKELTLEEIKEGAGLDEQEVRASLGRLKAKGAIEFFNKKIKITKQGKNLLEKESLEERFLKGKFPLRIEGLKDEEKYAFEELKKRDILKVEDKKEKRIELMELGKKLVEKKIEKKGLMGRLTADILKKKGWRGKEFRGYDIKINVPAVYGGRKHLVREAVEYVKKIWLEMGFKEMEGNLVETSFWNFDALFTAQDHPVRDIQDTFFIKEPAKGKLLNKKLVERVKRTHEDGWTTGSKGWQAGWDIEEARKNVLRTHTTCLSARAIAALKREELPAKFFAVGKCFRNETLDWSHLFELTQVEGIVVDEEANFRHLIGYLREFFKKMGYLEVRVRPAFFPYTEPSCEVEVLHPIKKKWIELGGAGIFRPEVVKPLLGEAVPVLAWGLGLERTILEYYGIKDIRELYKNDLKLLRGVKGWWK